MQKKAFLKLLSSAAISIAAAMSIPSASLVAASNGANARKADGAKPSNSVFIVRMADSPVASYDGRIRGYGATRPAEGAKIDTANSDTRRYRDYLASRHEAVVNQVGGRKIYSYELVFNGFAAELTDAQAQKIASLPGVLAVTRDELHHADTSNTPAFLALDKPGGLWWQLGGAKNAGKGVVVGIIDSGIWPENPSFASDSGGKGHHYGHDDDRWQIPGWSGSCVSGEEFDGDDACNGKIIGARYFNEAWGGDAGIDEQMPWEFNSPRDYDGHGSHTAATAAGNYRVQTDGPAAVLGKVSGMAPRARIAAYKALWANVDASTASGRTSDLVAAIDQAVADGVDVINYSISGTTTNFRDPVEIAFMYAADAGVFVAASAGNSGPNTSTVAHPSPWITTVAAGTHNRTGNSSLHTGDGVTYAGASLASTTVTAPIINSSDAGLPGADPTLVALCFADSNNVGVAVLDPAKVAGKIVVCDRGTNARVDKSTAVKEAGGVGMVLLNPTANSLNADFHAIPTVHLQNTDSAAVRDYAATPGATATIDPAKLDFSVPAPLTASFSSRGPLNASGDLLKPDLIAPGQDILAAFSPVLAGFNFNLLSGTSMSSPHVAGLAALLKDRHPFWSPMMIKSALMTTASDVLDGPNTDPLVIFRQGAGHVVPNKAIDPGLVFNSRMNDWLGFLCGTQLGADYCTSQGIPVLDPSDFNTPSIAIGDLAGEQTVTRTVTNVSWRGTYKATVTGLAGLTVSVSPATFTINPLKKQKITIRIQRTTAPLNAYAGGYITWSDGWHKVRVPVVVRPVPLGAPAQVSGSYNVRFGYDGPFTATARGLVPAFAVDDSVSDGETRAWFVPVSAGTTYARFSLFDENVNPASDLDLRVFRCSDAVCSGAVSEVGSSGGATSAEEVNLLNPVAATYIVAVDGYATADPSTYTLFVWRLGSADAGNMTVTAPGTATIGQTGAIGLQFIGLTSGVKYLGSVVYGGVAGLPNPTIVRVDP